jgi:hypothetical protein
MRRQQMKIATIENGKVSDGATVGKLSLKGACMEIPAIIVGEEGRGRAIGALPVQLDVSRMKEWERMGSVEIFHAEIGKTRKENPKLIAKDDPEGDDIIVVLRTTIGYRGGNVHTGDRDGDGFMDFPGTVIAAGVIAQGDAGRMGSGEQLVAIIRKGAVFRTGYSGRLYGGPSEHYYLYDGERVLACTKEEREIAEVF